MDDSNLSKFLLAYLSTIRKSVKEQFFFLLLIVEKGKKKNYNVYTSGTNLCPAYACFMIVCRRRVYLTREREEKKKI